MVCTFKTNGPFPHSCKQRHQLEAQVDKIQSFVGNCQPEPHPHFFMFAHCSVMRKRSIIALHKVLNADLVFAYITKIWFKYLNLHILKDQQKSD